MKLLTSIEYIKDGSLKERYMGRYPHDINKLSGILDYIKKSYISSFFSESNNLIVHFYSDDPSGPFSATLHIVKTSKGLALKNKIILDPGNLLTID